MKLPVRLEVLKSLDFRGPSSCRNKWLVFKLLRNAMKPFVKQSRTNTCRRIGWSKTKASMAKQLALFYWQVEQDFGCSESCRLDLYFPILEGVIDSGKPIVQVFSCFCGLHGYRQSWLSLWVVLRWASEDSEQLGFAHETAWHSLRSSLLLYFEFGTRDETSS